MTSVETRKSPAPFAAYLVIVAGWFFGFGLQTTLFPGIVYFTLTNSTPQQLGFAQMALTAPMLLLLPAAGVLAERRGRRRILMVFYALAAVLAAVLGALLVYGYLSYWLLVIYALAVGSCGAFVLPARDSAINTVVNIANRSGKTITLQKAVVIASLVQFAGQITGMGVGYLARWTGPGPLLFLQAGGFLLGVIATIGLPRLKARRTATTHAMQDLVEGIKTVFQSPVIGSMTAVMVAVGFFVVGGAFFVVIPVLVRDVYQAGYGTLSSLLVVFWIGAFIANALLAKLSHIERPGRAVMLAQLVTVISLGGLALPLPLEGLYALDFFWGLGAGVAISLSRSVVQENAPREMLARIMSVYQLGLFGGMPAGAAMMGMVVAAFGPRQSVLIPMIGLALVLALISIFTPILSVRRKN
ncbi:MFS transporter [Hyphobacterium sp. CCMP332]|jgi:MFS family permease|uniref:MFS transporter n=1 Tax=Hyphobacterium sp. CCMP332 TaxID=2749086 RepID=UPI00164FB954|nr:MFS transporter [Hyphobacterium sp. CCMP332]QNL19169.1 MFS transporter [Hyphobacterium sp. CCMP332]